MCDAAFSVVKWTIGLLHELEDLRSNMLSFLAYSENSGKLAISFFFMIILLAWKHEITIKVFTFFFARLFLSWNCSPVYCSLCGLTKGRNCYRGGCTGAATSS